MRAARTITEMRGSTFDHFTRYDPGCVPADPEVNASLKPKCTESRYLEQPVYRSLGPALLVGGYPLR